MIIVLKTGARETDIAAVEEKVRELGYQPHTIRGEVRTVVAAVGDESTHGSLEPLTHLPMVDRVLPIQKKYKLISRETHPEPAVVKVGDLTVGNGQFHVIAGPCSVETEEQTLTVARAVRRAGATMLRGGAFKPRTSPYSFQGLGAKGLEILARAKAETGLPIVTEVVREGDLELMCSQVDVLQIGARNALNYSLLEAVADTGKPILLKRGAAATVQEWLLAAEYIVKRGNRNVILCERGIRTFETATRNTLDLSAVAVAKLECRLPVIVDPSHGAGRWDIIIPLSKAAAAVGADGLIIEVHPQPEMALSDGDQQLEPELFARLMQEIAPFVQAAGRSLAAPGPLPAPH
jgi:3-deoxy-7-phosphoheptulonate synthase